ncbi:MAG TPA: peptidylprolyl isomerase [Alphaproteobacteria bacterium]|nr:peptidylprolyl isomerase [Alphaproteobacteria bacterium]HNS45286.1 peptidylprolyl isomerase [Alphaproteobacteria bacterium]
MNKTVFGLVLAIIVAAGAGFGVFSMMSKDKSEASEAKTEATAAATQAVEEVAASTEPAASEEDKDNPVVAKVDGKEIRRSEVLDFMENLPTQMKQLPPETVYPMVLEQVINAKVIDNKVAGADLGGNPEVAKRMDQAKTQILRAVYAEEQIEKNYKEEDTKAAYDKMVAEMPKVEEVKASHILVDDEATAKEIIKKLGEGAKFADLAKQYSKDKSNAESGGDLGYFTQGDMVKEFGDAAFAMKKGEFSKEPVKTQFGYHVILQEDKRARPAPKYDDVKDQLAAQGKRELLNKLIEDWRKDSTVEEFDFDGKPLPKKEDAKEEPKAE